MSSRFYVTAEFHGETITGIFFDQRLLSETAAPGMAIVADLILPVSYEIDEAAITELSWYEANRVIEVARGQAVEHSRGLGAGIAIGKLFSLAHEDGDVWYVVTELADSYAHVEWRGFGENRRQDRGWAGVAGTTGW